MTQPKPRSIFSCISVYFGCTFLSVLYYFFCSIFSDFSPRSYLQFFPNTVLLLISFIVIWIQPHQFLLFILGYALHFIALILLRMFIYSYLHFFSISSIYDGLFIFGYNYYFLFLSNAVAIYVIFILKYICPPYIWFSILIFLCHVVYMYRLFVFFAVSSFRIVFLIRWNCEPFLTHHLGLQLSALATVVIYVQTRQTIRGSSTEVLKQTDVVIGMWFLHT